LLNICYGGFILCSGLLLTLTLRGSRSVHLIYLVLLLLGAVRSFNWPASRALLPELVPAEYFSKAVAWNATTFQAATILGPALGGVLYAANRGPSLVYEAATGASAIALVATLRIRSRSESRPAEEMTLHTMMAGFRYVWREKVVLGSVSLDMFAVLLGGAVALLPVYASEILKTGPWGLGLLRSAPGAGAAIMALFLAKKPIAGRAGLIMLWCVGGFGIFTILFGVSRSLTLSLLALLLVGATDMVSVIIRATLVQFATPDPMRGRVNAVDMLVWHRARSRARRCGNADRDRIVGLAISRVAKSGSTAPGRPRELAARERASVPELHSSGQTRASAPTRFEITFHGSPSWPPPCCRSDRRPGLRPRARPDQRRSFWFSPPPPGSPGFRPGSKF